MNMDAIEFVYEQARMCKAMKGCTICPYDKICACHANSTWSIKQIERAVKTVEQWAKDNPQETRWTLLKKQYPNMKDNAKFSICARDLGYECKDCALVDCEECWDVPVEEGQE